MRKRGRLSQISAVVVVLVAVLLVVACGTGAPGNQVTIVCDDCDTVELWDTSHATRLVGEVKPGDTGVTTEKVWSALQGCMFHYVIIGDQEGWVCDKYLDFR
ncbi:MAG: hypothetical protein GTO63_34890 [Anaerolineae bacterium]|nr:hypothetical protein [Anaerolineae bacterium]NIN99881.1 hypothetical protein [Anaerolineae bacterium]NIQ82658.1 hypothetical protein [Anaerolineae bacterium]